MSATFVDLFCGAGGSINGMVDAGFELLVGANHWTRAIETVSSNHPGADFLCTDINHYDMRRLPRSDVLWASVICTEMSPAGGTRKYRGQQRLDLEQAGHVPSEAYERTRACGLGGVRATEVHRYQAVVVENVVEFARDWELYEWWVEGMCRLGYQVQTVNVSAAHIYDDTNPPAPQWRDRIFIVFTRVGVRRPELDPRPPAWCARCARDVEARQVWKRPDRRRVGKYGQQYLYACPACAEIVEPYVAPALTALDLADVGERIGDRRKPLADKTLARIRWGLEHLAWPVVATVVGNTYEAGQYRRAWPAATAPLTARQATGTDAICGPVIVNHGHSDQRVFAAGVAPLATRTTKIGEGVLRPFVTMARANNRPTGVDEPLDTVATGRHHYLTSPPGSFYIKNYGGNARPEHLAKLITGPLGSITTIDHHALVIPYRRTSRARPATGPLPTVATHTSAGILQPAVTVEDCYFRTLKPREHLRAQRFYDDYVVAGNQGEQTMQAGNAVPCNAAQWIGRQLLEVLS